MFGFSLRRVAWMTLLLAGCGGAESPPVAVQESALSSCNSETDCTLPSAHGTCVKMACNNHACVFAMDTTACPMGCTAMGQLTECPLGTGGCILVPCTGGACAFDDYSRALGCECTDTMACPAPTNPTCQNAAICTSGTCTYTAKQPLAQPCCNVRDDCGGTATCISNACNCGNGNKFCSGATPGSGHCVASSGCCAATECPTGNSCQARTCSVAGACGFKSNGNAGCCDDNAQCGGTATCNASNQCVCGAGEKFCPGATAGSGACRSETDVMFCGSGCTPCPTGNSCQTPVCTAGSCGLVATSAPGCCTTVDNCPMPTDPCSERTCVANQCGTAPIAGCVVDMATSPPSDLAQPEDLAQPGAVDFAAAPDQSLSATGGGGCAIACTSCAPNAFLGGLVALALLALFVRRNS
jgi:hypothetical protein